MPQRVMSDLIMDIADTMNVSHNDVRIAITIIGELRRARKLHGPMQSYHEGIAVIREEYIELEQEVFTKDPSNIKMNKEASHLAAMAIRFIVDLTVR